MRILGLPEPLDIGALFNVPARGRFQRLREVAEPLGRQGRSPTPLGVLAPTHLDLGTTNLVLVKGTSKILRKLFQARDEAGLL
eukprot:13793386-Alexandrium_andersonii.AAC.1